MEKSITVSATIPHNLHRTAKEKGIGWSEALQFGIKYMASPAYQTDLKKKKVEDLNKKKREIDDLLAKLKSEVIE